MVKILRLLAMTWVLSGISSGTLYAADQLDEYRLNTGDKIKIYVYGEPDMDVETRLASSGDIRYPFLGKIHVSGLSVAELEHKITRALKDGYFVDPQVRVSVEEFRPFYVNGEVKKPGDYPYKPGMTYRMAISMAGGMKERGDENKVFVIHEGKGNQAIKVTDLDSEMNPGDVITVKQSFF